MSALKINQNEFNKVRENVGVSLVDFYADWCGPCRMVAPVLEEIAQARSDILVGKVNVDESPELAGRYGVFSIPTLVVLRDGKETARSVGAKPKAELLALVDG